MAGSKIENCTSLNGELEFFQDLILDILTQRVVFKRFESEMKKKCLTEHNDMMALVWYGYIISQLSECRKFFDRDNNTHSFNFVVRHLKDEDLKKKHGKLFEEWKNKKLETVLNKYLLHADKRVSEIKTEVSVKTLDAFVDNLESYLKEIVQDLTKSFINISSSNYDTYLKDREEEVNVFFEEVRK